MSTCVHCGNFGPALSQCGNCGNLECSRDYGDCLIKCECGTPRYKCRKHKRIT